jgi:hypothetical protein
MKLATLTLIGRGISVGVSRLSCILLEWRLIAIKYGILREGLGAKPWFQVRDPHGELKMPYCAYSFLVQQFGGANSRAAIPKFCPCCHCHENTWGTELNSVIVSSSSLLHHKVPHGAFVDGSGSYVCCFTRAFFMKSHLEVEFGQLLSPVLGCLVCDKSGVITTFGSPLRLMLHVVDHHKEDIGQSADFRFVTQGEVDAGLWGTNNLNCLL